MELSVVLTLHVISERTVYISLLLYLLPEQYHTIRICPRLLVNFWFGIKDFPP
jgi:hypothetical protein